MKERLGKSSPRFIIAVLVLIIVLAGCSSNTPPMSTGAASSTDALKSAAPFDLSITVSYNGKEIPKPGNPVQQAIEKYTNTKLNITYISGNEYGNKLPVLVASGDLPKAISSYGPAVQPYLVNAFLNGAFWDVSPYIKDFSNLSKLNQATFNNAKVQGKLYGLPIVRPLARNVFIYRKDWLDALGLKEPATLDEFYNMLKAFRDNDPDKDGKNDTYGMSVFTSTDLPDINMGVFFGAPNKWAVQDGKFIKAEETPESFATLQYLKKLYDEKLINPDFATVDRAKFEGEFENSKAGVIGNTTNTAIAYEARVQSHVPTAKVSYFSILEGTHGKRVAAGPGSVGLMMFPKTSVKSEDELKRVVGFFDKLGDQPMADLLEWGLEGTHYQLQDGKRKLSNQAAYDEQVFYPYKTPLGLIPTAPVKTPGFENPLNAKEIQVTTENEKYLVSDPTLPLISKTYQERGAELDLILKDAKVKFIMGKIDEAAYKNEVQRWKTNGGDQVAAEFAAAYANAKANP